MCIVSLGIRGPSMCRCGTCDTALVLLATCPPRSVDEDRAGEDRVLRWANVCAAWTVVACRVVGGSGEDRERELEVPPDGGDDFRMLHDPKNPAGVAPFSTLCPVGALLRLRRVRPSNNWALCAARQPEGNQALVAAHEFTVRLWQHLPRRFASAFLDEA